MSCVAVPMTNRVHADLKKALEEHRHVLDDQDAKVCGFWLLLLLSLLLPLSPPTE